MASGSAPEIAPRHWRELAKRHGIAAEGADSLFEQLIVQTPAVIERVHSLLPRGFPAEVSEAILDGLAETSERFHLARF